jgi:predicted phage terminase large subunit-like protein
VAFIPARITDNKAGLARDPGYMANLKALPLLEREQLLMGNWKIRPVSGMFFRRGWFPIVQVAPSVGRIVRYWDRAATEPGPRYPDPDWTVGIKGIRAGNTIFILDVCRFRGRPEMVLQTIKNVAAADGEDVEQWLEEDPGQAGKAERAMYYRDLEGVGLRFLRPVGSKVKRAMPASAQAEAGNISIVRAPWNENLFSELEAFADWDHVPKDDHPPVLPHDDQVDGLSGLTHVLLSGGAVNIG